MSMRSEPRKNHQVKMNAWGGGVVVTLYQRYLVNTKILTFIEKDALTLKACSVFDKANAAEEKIGVA